MNICKYDKPDKGQNTMPAHNLMWFRRDLRLKDNHALSEALKSDLPVKCIFIFDQNILNKFKNPNHPQVTFMWHYLQELRQKLQQTNSDLYFYHGDPLEILKSQLTKGAKHIYFNEDYEPYAIKRDSAVIKTGKASSFKDQVCFGPAEVLKKDLNPYSVYTPYKNKWLEQFDKSLIKEYKLNTQNFLEGQNKNKFSLKKLGYEEFQYKLPSKSIPKSIFLSYAKQRDLPYLKSTSQLGPHLRMGTISIRNCIQKSLRAQIRCLAFRTHMERVLYADTVSLPPRSEAKLSSRV